MTAVEFPPSLFTDPSRAQRNLLAIHQMFITSGSQFSLEEFSLALRGQLVLSPDPDMAITNLLRFSEATLSKASLFNDLLKYPVTFEVLLKVFGYSQYFADILVRDPELFRWLTASDVLMIPQTKRTLVAEVQRIGKMFAKPERRLDALRRLYRREVLRIGAKDILGNADLATSTKELSQLSDVLIDASCKLAELVMQEKYCSTAAVPYAVIGLGKLGGEELNYSSDIDIIFVYGEEGELSTTKLTYHEYFNKFVERVVQNLSQSSGEGHLYRVDTRLRPESGMGPLARSMQSYLLYYESRGELWERQMLIKARPVAGDLEFGEKFLHELAPFIYPRTFFTNPTESIARIKSRIETAVADDDNIKLQAGGIRDIEFIVQALQLLNGGKNERVRSRNTLHSIALLAAEKLLSAEEDAALTDAYVFFRTLEHRLQNVLNMQTHSIPSDERERGALAKRIGLGSIGELDSQLESHRNAVKEIFDSVINTGATTRVARGIEAVIDGGMSEVEIRAVLAQVGFKDIPRAQRIVQQLVSGNVLTGGQAIDSRARDAFRLVAAEVFEAISKSPSPDLTLNNLSVLIESHRFPEQLFSSLKEESFRKLVFGVCRISPRLTRALAKDKLLMEMSATNAGGFIEALDNKSPAHDELTSWKNRQELSLCIRHVLGVISFREFTAALSRLADEIVGSVFQLGCKLKKLDHVPLTVLALGKYGTRELSVDADLDLIFISGEKTKSATNRLERIATGMIQKLTSVNEGGRLYDIDARLRPEGHNSPLVVDRKAYATYLRERASLWERQSLTRLRFVCGDKSLSDEVEKDIEAFVYETPLSPTWTDDIVAMRRKMESRSHTRSLDFFDVKLGTGGMVDVEFIAQMLQLKLDDSSLKGLPTVEVIQAVPRNLLSAEHASALRRAYEMYRRLEILMRLTFEERTTILPEGEKLELLAKLLNVSNGDELRTQISNVMKEVRLLFLQTAKTLSPN